MKTHNILLVALASMPCFTGCTTTQAPMPVLPSLESRLSRDWLSTASHIRSGSHIVFYHGTAHRTEGTPRSPWLGTVTGDILALSPTNAIVCPSGTVTLDAANRISIKGPHRTNITDAAKASWKHLLRE